jgi:hypothetical protein
LALLAGVTRAAIESSAFSRTTITSTVTTGRASHKTPPPGNVTIGPAVGAGYAGQLSSRNYSINIHGIKAPSSVQVNCKIVRLLLVS